MSLPGNTSSGTNKGSVFSAEKLATLRGSMASFVLQASRLCQASACISRL